MYKIDTFRAGALKNHLERWYTVTSDFETLQTVAGLQLEFSLPLNFERNYAVPFSAEENEFILAEFKTLQDKHVITECDHEGDEFISPIFLVPKDGDSFRLILNLRKLNESMPYMHFKMDTFDKVIKLVRQNCFMCTVDIKDAYYSVAISESCQKYLKFKYQDKLFKFLALPNGLCSGPRKFTKLLKPALAFLRNQGFIVSAYIDDIIIIDESYDACIKATVETIK